METVNDLDGDIVNFFRVLRDPTMRQDLIEACRLTPYAREEFEHSYAPTDDPLERARRTCIRAAMGFGSAGATKASTGFRTDTRRKYGTAQHNWSDYPGALGAIGERLAGVLIENRDAVDVMLSHDGHDTLFFVDPPYVHSTRSIRNKGGYRHELDDEGHGRLIDALKAVDGMVVLCGYDSEIYRIQLEGWETFSTTARISGGRGTSLRTEVLWLNPACSAALQRSRGGLFAETYV